jgi:hypothetical protein
VARSTVVAGPSKRSIHAGMPTPAAISTPTAAIQIADRPRPRVATTATESGSGAGIGAGAEVRVLAGPLAGAATATGRDAGDSTPLSTWRLSRCRSARRSAALWQRRSACFSSVRPTMRSNSPGTSARSSRIGRGEPLRIAAATSGGSTPSKARVPVAIS